MSVIDHYVLGFLIDASERHVVLIRKSKPAWQAGRLNGIGGRIEAQELPFEAMARECEEETGRDWESWQEFLMMTRLDSPSLFLCHIYRAFVRKWDWPLAGRRIDEGLLDWFPIDPLPQECLSNVPWLVHMALDLNPGDGGPYHIGGVVGETRR